MDNAPYHSLRGSSRVLEELPHGAGTEGGDYDCHGYTKPHSTQNRWEQYPDRLSLLKRGVYAEKEGGKRNILPGAKTQNNKQGEKSQFLFFELVQGEKEKERGVMEHVVPIAYPVHYPRIQQETDAETYA